MLYIVATPIGNLEDITLRALRILKESDFILCEDTRVTSKLLMHYKIKKPLINYHQHSKENIAQNILNLLREGKTLALVTDAGTPGISDPGNELIEKIYEEFNQNVHPVSGRAPQDGGTDTNGVKVEPIPGPSALTAAASISGMPMNEFVFLGYPPAKNKRKKFFERVVQSDVPAILYESPHRIIRSLEELKQAITNNESRIMNYEFFVARELTKKFESTYRGSVEEVLKKLTKR